MPEPSEPPVLSYCAPELLPERPRRMVGRFAGGTILGGVAVGLLWTLLSAFQQEYDAGTLVCGVPLFTVAAAAIGSLLLYCGYAVTLLIWKPLVPRQPWLGYAAGLAYLPGNYGWVLAVDSIERHLLPSVGQGWILLIMLMPLVMWPVAIGFFLWRREA